MTLVKSVELTTNDVIYILSPSLLTKVATLCSKQYNLTQAPSQSHWGAGGWNFWDAMNI